MDISNGVGIGIALFTQGCHFHCENCFNKEAWDFNGGEEWTETIEDKFIELANKDYVQRISILGGEPLEQCNLFDLYKLVTRLKLLYPKKKIWIYTGYTYESILKETNKDRLAVLMQADYLVDGQFIDSLKDYRLKYKGSSNQRIIDLQSSLKKGKTILYDKL